MTDLRDRVKPAIKRDTHAPVRPVRGPDEAADRVVPLVMVGGEPRLIAGRRLPGRGAGVWRAADMLALQRTMGNRATQRALVPGAKTIQRKPPGFSERQQYMAVQGHVRNVPPGAAKTKPKDRATPANTALTYGKDVINTPKDALGAFAIAAVKERSTDEDVYYAKDAKYTKQVGDADTRANLGAASYGIGAGGSLLAMGGGIAQIFMLSKKLKDAKGADKVILPTEIASQVGLVGANLGQAGTGISAAVAKAVHISDSENSAAGAASTISGGIGNALGALGAVFELIISSGKGVSRLVKLLGGKAADKKTEFFDMLADFMTAGKNFLSIANNAIFAASKFLTVAKASAEFVQNVPFIGGAINIVTQVIDILVQSVKSVNQVIRMVRAKRYQAKMKAAALAAKASAEKHLSKYLGDINRKRFRRAIIPLISAVTTVVGDLISIGGSVLNIVGSATAGAMGAGAGLYAAGVAASATAAVVKLGAASLKPASWLVRHGKQKIRDMGKGDTSKKRYKLGKKFGINMDKTSKEKDKELNTTVSELLTYLLSLKDDGALGRLSPAKKAAEIEKYTTAKYMLKATGLTPKELLDAKSFAEVCFAVKEAMKARD